MKHLDLFSGGGGFALAAKNVGFETVAFSEVDPYAIEVLKKNFPTIPNLGDITKLKDKLCSYLPEASHAKTLVLREKEKDLKGNGVDSFTKWQPLLKDLNQIGLCSKMFPDFSLQRTEKTCSPSCINWSKSGIAYAGECLMLNTSEWLNDVNVSGLSEVLETHVPSKFYLSKKAVAGMIRRSMKFGRGGFVFLQETAKDKTQQVKLLSLQRFELMITPAGTEVLKDPTSSLIPLGVPSAEHLALYGSKHILRRLTPTEKEKLMGFPHNWTLIAEESWGTPSSRKLQKQSLKELLK